jgi:hypothetical protein
LLCAILLVRVGIFAPAAAIRTRTEIAIVDCGSRLVLLGVFSRLLHLGAEAAAERRTGEDNP